MEYRVHLMAYWLVPYFGYAPREGETLRVLMKPICIYKNTTVI